MSALSQAWSDDELVQLYARVNNAGRWGPDDELGTLNFITPEKRREAATLVRMGETLSLAQPLSSAQTADQPGQVEYRMLYGHMPGQAAAVLASAGEYIGLAVHQPAVTHLDCISHVAGYDGRVYNDRRFGDVVTSAGISHGSIYAQRRGIFTRGVLLDVAAAIGVDFLEPAHRISVAELEAAERYGGVDVSSGDVLVLRAGNEARDLAMGPHPLSPGPGPDCIAWMHEREIAVYTGDAPEYVTPAAARVLGRAPADAGAAMSDAAHTRFPLLLHQVGLAAMGLVLLDHCRVEELAQHCRRLGRYEFLFVVAPLPLPSGTGSPVNPLAVF